ncbi:MAG: hypothetical protein QM677_02875 [Microbacterium sp.]
MTAASPPPRRHSAAVYRRRRLGVLLVIVVLVATIALAIWQPWRGWVFGDAAQTPAPSGATSSASATPSATSSTTASVTPASETSATPEPSASATETAIATCTTGDISVLAVTDQDSYAAGELPQLSITLSNTSDDPCLINVGTSTQSFVITSGSDTWWRSTDCQTESSDQVVQLEAGQTVSSVTPIEWDRTRSAVDTCDADRSAAPAGYYHLQVSIGGVQGADTKMFELQ